MPPTPLDFRCPRCHALPGERCTGTPRAVEHCHMPRQDRFIRAANRAALASPEGGRDD